MMRAYKFLLFTVLTVVIGACGTTHMSIQTNPPGAEVFIKPVGHKDFVQVGVTPLVFSNEDLIKHNAAFGAVQMELRKDGYKPDSFYVTEIDKLDLNIVREMRPKRDLEAQTWLNYQVEGMFEVTRLVQAKRYDDALRLIRELKKQAPMVATIHELEGGVLVLKREYRAALDSYRMAVKYNPESHESVKMVRHLEQTYGFPREIDYTDMDRPAKKKLESAGTMEDGERTPAKERSDE